MNEQRSLTERLMAHVRTLAQWQRLAGTDDERSAFSYIESELKSYGLRVRLVEHDGYISLPGPASLAVTHPGLRSFSCITHSFSQSTPPGGLEAELVYVGRGRPADYEGLDVSGKVVLMDGLASPGPAVTAGRRGALGHIHINPAEHVHEMIISPVWGSPTDRQAEQMPRTVALSICQADGAALKELLADGPVRVRLQARVDTGWQKLPLLEAQIDGTDEPEHFVLFSGHVDSWYYGAMDNASANAVMLEIARLFAARPLRRSLRLAFWSGHSHGRYAGSAWYVDEHWADLDQGCVAHVNIDSPGGRGATVIEEPQTMSEAVALLQGAIVEAGGGQIRPRRLPRAGDHSFWGVGITSLLVGPSEQPAGPDTYNPLAGVMPSDSLAAGYGWWWHTADDTPDKLDPVLLERDAGLYRTVLERLLNEPVLPFDFTPVVTELKQNVTELVDPLQGRLDLTPTLSALANLEQQVVRLAELALNQSERAGAVNRSFMELGRHLIPLLYTCAGRFQPDPALGLPPMAFLTPLKKLADTAPDSDESRFQRAEAVRTLNQFRWTVEQACFRVRTLLVGGL